MKVGYTCGVFDLFHIGHVNILRNSRALCDKLIVAVTVDEVMKEYKNKTPVIPYLERVEVVRSCKYVDLAISQVDHDKFEAWKRLKFDVLFVADGWYDTPKWKEYERKLKEVGVEIVYFPYTQGTSSTLINQTLDKLRD